MRLERAKIRNSRSLRDVEVAFGDHTALLGGNGAGKSSILKAIEKFYANTRTIETDDHFGRNTDTPVEIELTFSELSGRELQAFERRVRDGKLTVTRVFDGTPTSGRYVGSVLQNPDFAPVRSQTGAAPKIAAYRELRREQPEYAESLPAVQSAAQVEDALQAWETAHPNALELLPDDGQFFGFQNASRGALKRYTNFVFIPAVREAHLDASDGKGSAIGQLLELVVRSAILGRADVIQFKNDMAARYQELVAPERMPELGVLAERLTTDLRGLYKDASVGLSWRPVPDFPVPLPIADVSLSDDGFGGPVDRQGHGLQRAFILTLLQYLARAAHAVEPGEADPALPPEAPALILAIEEPELYQHPTKQRHFTNVLRGLSSGALPGAQSATQVIFGSHSPLFVSLANPEEIRLVRRIPCGDGEFKQCELRSLSLDQVAIEIEAANQEEPGTFNATTLKPRLHVLGVELAEGFFASGIVLVEGRSDKAMLQALARMHGRSFEASGIAILSAEGKNSLDKPYAIFKALGIPVYIMWDCDRGKKEQAANLALLRLMHPEEDHREAQIRTFVGDRYAHFEDTLERTLLEELSEQTHAECVSEACTPFGLTPSHKHLKIPEVMYQTLFAAERRGVRSATLFSLFATVWLHLQGEDVEPLDLARFA